MNKKYVCFRSNVSVQDRVAMLLRRLGKLNDDGLESIEDLYGIHKNTFSTIIKEFRRVVRKHL